MGRKPTTVSGWRRGRCHRMAHVDLAVERPQPLKPSVRLRPDVQVDRECVKVISALLTTPTHDQCTRGAPPRPGTRQLGGRAGPRPRRGSAVAAPLVLLGQPEVPAPSLVPDLVCFPQPAVLVE